MKTEYKECPFCGGKHITGRMAKINSWDNYFVICCEECHAVMTFFNDNDESVADMIDRYNRRLTA